MSTMPTYPGVYIEEIPSGVHTITGVATSIAAFFGRTAKGPLDKAVRCLNYGAFTRNFGGAHEKSDLADNVRLFFLNGGTDCYVIRLAKDAKAANITLKDINGKGVLVVSAKAEGKWGNTVRLEVDYNTPNPDETFNLRVIHENEGRTVTTETFSNLSMNPNASLYAPEYVTQNSNLIKLDLVPTKQSLSNSFDGFSQARRVLPDTPKDVAQALVDLINNKDVYKFDINVDDKGYATVDLKNDANIKATSSVTNPDIESQIQTAINKSVQQVDPGLKVKCEIKEISDSGNTLGHILNITSDTTDEISVRVRRSSENDIAAALMLGIDQGGIEPVKYSNFRPVPTASFTSFLSKPSAFDDDVLNKISILEQDKIKQIIIGTDKIYLGSKLVTVTPAPGAKTRWYQNKLSALGYVHGNNDGVREKLKIIATAINEDVDTAYRAEVWGYHLAIIAKKGNIDQMPSVIKTNISPAADDYFANPIEKNVRQYSLGTVGNPIYVNSATIGDDGIAPDKASYLGDKDKQTGFHALDAVDIFNLMVLPADKEVDLIDIWGPASIYCQNKRAFLLIDAPEDWTNSMTGRPQVVQDPSKVGELRARVTKENSAVFYPRIKYKPLKTMKIMGPAGAIAGLMARIDSTRGVWKAPAGTEADIKGISGLKVKLTDRENGILNKLAVNCLREFPGGYVNWGARTMDGFDNSTKDDWKYIPVRRLTLFLEESLFHGTKWVVFEPNDEPLWAKIRLNVGVFMKRLFRQGAFQGSTPEQAYYVKCDAETTIQDDRNRGIVNIEVGFAPLKPAEFVIIKIQQIAGELI